MTTIFLKEAKVLTISYLNQIIKAANAADSAMLFSYFRDIKLSAEQIKSIQGLIDRIKSLPAQKTDAENYANLKRLLLEADTMIETIRGDYQWEKGTTNEKLENLNSKLDVFYYKLQNLSYNLLDVPADEDPFHVFCANAVLYLGYKAFFPKVNDWWTKTKSALFSWTTGSSQVKVKIEKEKLLLDNLAVCEHELKSVIPGHTEKRKKDVLSAIKLTLDGNKGTCKKDKLDLALPVAYDPLGGVVKIPLPPIKASRGNLRLFMENAQHEIDPTNNPDVRLECYL